MSTRYPTLIGPAAGRMEGSATIGFNKVCNRLIASGHDIVMGTAGQPGLKGPEVFYNEMVRLLGGGLPVIRGYGLHHNIKPAIAEYTCRHTGLSIDPKSIILTTGGKGYMDLFYAALSNPGNVKAVILGPAIWTTHKVVMEFWGYAVTVVDSVDEMIEFIQKESPVLAVIVSPCNPSNRIVGMEDLLNIANACDSRGTYLLGDHVYWSLNTKAPSVLQTGYLRAAELQSMSKASSLVEERLGWGICQCPEMIHALGAMEEQRWSNIPHRAAFAMASTMNSDAWRNHEKLIAETLTGRQRMMIADIESANIPVGKEPGMYVWINASQYLGKSGNVQKIPPFSNVYAGGTPLLNSKQLQMFLIQTVGVALIGGFNTRHGIRISASMEKNAWDRYWERMQEGLNALK